MGLRRYERAVGGRRSSHSIENSEEPVLSSNVSARFTVTLISEIRRTNAVAVMAYDGFWSLVRNFTDDQTVGGYYTLQPSPRA